MLASYSETRRLNSIRSAAFTSSLARFPVKWRKTLKKYCVTLRDFSMRATRSLIKSGPWKAKELSYNHCAVRCDADSSAAESKTADAEEASCTGLITISCHQNAVENGSISVTKSSNELNKGSRIGRNSGKLTQTYRPSQRAWKRYGKRLRRWFLPIDPEERD